MTFVSYAQNFEDVMLWRALKHIGNGLYIDIGAQDPVIDSVSLAFYEHGWRGVHVEPTLQYSAKLRSARPDETVIQAAIGIPPGPLTFFEFGDTGLSTADADIARSHQGGGFRCKETTVPVISLDELFGRVGAQNIHWLKIDVEGLEKSVLESWKGSSVLPWVLVIESTLPMSKKENYAGWEPLILEKGYRFVYFDGLNRFYISPEHNDLSFAFSSPPNVFDGFLLGGKATHPFYKLLDSKARQAETKAQQAEAKAQQAEIALLAMINSSSWRLTAPLRKVSVLARNLLLLLKVEYSKAKEKVTLFLEDVIFYVNRRPGLRHVLLAIVDLFPSFKIRLKRLSMGGAYARREKNRVAPEFSDLTPRAASIYADLQKSIKRRKS